MKRFVLMTIAIAFSFISRATDDRNIVPAELKTATVYRSGAELVHNAKATVKQGSSELIIGGISGNIDVNSLQVKCPASVTLLGVEFNNNYLAPENISPVVKRMQDSVEKIQDDIEKIDVSITTTTELLSVLKSNKEIKGTQTGLSVAELMKLMDYYKVKSNELQNELAALNVKKKKLETIEDRLNDQVEEEQKKNTKSDGKIVLQLYTAINGSYDFEISYITQNAYWTPYYDIKADDIKSPMKIIYKAKIIQTTGIDWKKVKLSLSTSTPTQYGNAPLLKSWFLAYVNPVNVLDKSLLKSGRVKPDISKELEGKVAGIDIRSGQSTPGSATRIQIRGNSSFYGDNQPLIIVDGVPYNNDQVSAEGTLAGDGGYGSGISGIDPNMIASMSILKGSSAAALYGSRASNGVIIITLKKGLEDFVSVSSNELDVTYDIDLPYDVPTNGKPQIATLKEATIAAGYKYYSVPKLDKDAFLLAEISDWGKLNLLPGEANIIFEGTYIGQTFIDPSSTNDTLNFTMGKDKRVVIKREKLKDYSSVKFLGSNKLQQITYEIIVKNNKKDAVKLLLKDQYPVSTNKEIEIELLESSGAAVNTETGIISWNLDLAPGESKKVRISYSVKYPKGKMLGLN